MKMFFQLQKADEKTGLVTGRACAEVIDHAGEIFDYEKSKPNFSKWSTGIAKATEGKSVGNVRAMHGKVSAGILKDIVFNDAEKAIDVTALINDPVEKAKLFAGNYTGFSIGGSYVGEKWEDPVHKGVMRYEADPAEISIVDLPCIPTATFTAVKADGSQELRKFHVAEEGDVKKTAAADEGTSPGTATKTDVEPSAAAAPVAKVHPEKLMKRAAALAKNTDAHRILETVRGAYGLPAVEKGLYDVCELADVLSRLSWLQECAESEAAWEGDNSAVPEELRASVKQLGQILLDMAQEEVAEIVGDEAEVEIIIELAAKVGDLRKRNTDAIVKALYELSKALEIAPPVAKAEPAPLSKVAKAVLDETTHALEKARGELSKARERITELEKLPAAKAPVLRMVGKGDGGSATEKGDAIEVTPVMVGGQEDPLATRIKKLRAQQMSKN
jgi:hypothetical protein